MPNIFISYRRQETAGYAHWMADKLDEKFGHSRIFRDIGSIGPGRNFVEAIECALGTCDVMLVLIGANWLTITDPKTGQPRLRNPKDYVRMEIATALARQDILTIPVLLQNASMPSEEHLPDDLSSLAHRNAFELRDTSYTADLEHLIRFLEEHSSPRGKKRVLLLAGAVATILLLASTAASGIGIGPLAGALVGESPNKSPNEGSSGQSPSNQEGTAGEERTKETDSGATNNSRASSDPAAPSDSTPSEENTDLEMLREAVQAYYEAVDRGDWDYTYDHLDSQTRQKFTRDEWTRKNQYFAAEYPLQSISPTIEGPEGSPSKVKVTVFRTFQNLPPNYRDSYFVYEGGSWEHQFSPDELELFMAGSSFEEFKKAQQDGASERSTETTKTSQEKAAVESAIRGHYAAIGAQNFDKAFSYFSSTNPIQNDKQGWIDNEETSEITASTINSLEVIEVSEGTATANAEVSFRDKNGTSCFNLTWDLVKEDGQWKLDKPSGDNC